MEYRRFEWLTIGVGAATVLATVLMTLSPRPDLVELAAQVLILCVLVGAVHWGRKGGLIAAVAATVLYVLLRIPSVAGVGVSSDLLELIIVRAGTYGLIGVAGGELCGRIKYFFARLEDSLSIDEVARVYNQRFIGQLLRTSLSTHARYRVPFSVVSLTLAPGLTSELRPAKVGTLVRTVADTIRDDIRLVDEVGRLDDGTFLMLLPHTPKAGAEVAAARVRAGVRDVLGAKDASVVVTVLGAEEDLEPLTALAETLAPAIVAAPER